MSFKHIANKLQLNRMSSAGDYNYAAFRVHSNRGIIDKDGVFLCIIAITCLIVI